MVVSAEIRWFWRARPPSRLDEWFLAADVHGCAAGGGTTRTDRYLRDRSEDELGLKVRGGRKGVEMKGLVVKEWGRATTKPFSGTLQLWAKWISTALELPWRCTVAAEKQRWLRKFDTSGSGKEIALGRDEQPLGKRGLPKAGCNVEWTRVTLDGGVVWWTLGFEAFGPIDTLERSIRLTAKQLASRHPPPLRGGIPASYPTWLKRRTQ